MPEFSKNIEIKTPSGEECTAYPSSSSLYACCSCGHGFDVGEPIVICSDCGGMFCRTCVEDGTFSDHICDDGEEEFED